MLSVFMKATAGNVKRFVQSSLESKMFAAGAAEEQAVTFFLAVLAA